MNAKIMKGFQPRGTSQRRTTHHDPAQAGTGMEIEKDIPIPEDRVPTVYPFAKMEVGDSLTRDGEAGQKLAQAARVYAARHPEWNCLTRKLKETGATRVWRTL